MDLWKIKTHTAPTEKRAPHVFCAELKDGSDYTFTITDEALEQLVDLYKKFVADSKKK